MKGLMIKAFEGVLATPRRVTTHTESTGLGRSVISVTLDLTVRDLPLTVHKVPPTNPTVTHTSPLNVVDRNPTGVSSWQDLGTLLVGTGAYAGTAVAQLRAHSACDIANIQTSRRVVSFVQIRRTRVVEPEDTVAALQEADLVLACRGLDSPVLSADQAVMATLNRHRPLVILDLTLHADVGPRVHQLSGVKTWNLEDIRAYIFALVISQIQHANEPTREGLTDYDVVVAAWHMDPVIVRLRALFEAVACEEVATLPPGETVTREDAERVIWYVVRKLAYTPTVLAHMTAESGPGSQWVDILATVWGLTPEVLGDAFSG